MEKTLYVKTAGEENSWMVALGGVEPEDALDELTGRAGAGTTGALVGDWVKVRDGNRLRFLRVSAITSAYVA